MYQEEYKRWLAADLQDADFAVCLEQERTV